MPGSRPRRSNVRARSRRRDDAGAASMVTYTVAAAIFVIGTSYLLQFAVDPPGTSTASLSHANLRTVAQGGLDALLGGPGHPVAWDADAPAINNVQKLGLIESGSSLRVDAAKFDALARGHTWTKNSANGVIDYDEAKTALGLTDHDFHLRGYPSISPSLEGPYGVKDMTTFRVGYVGEFVGTDLQGLGVNERGAIDALAISFDPARRKDSTTGDVYADAIGDVRENLLPTLGTTLHQVVLGPGVGTPSDFRIVPSTVYAPHVGGGSGSALALSPDGTTLGYTKAREMRVIVGAFNMAGRSSAELKWNEWVDSDNGTGAYDCDDHGVVQVSPDQGVTWYTLQWQVAPTPLTLSPWSADCLSTSPAATPHAAAMSARTVTNIVEACPACNGAARVLVAFRWIADNDNTMGRGWVVDDLRVTAGSDVLLNQRFEPREYNMLVVGSKVKHAAFASEEIKHAIRDYVDVHGGRLLVLGGQTDADWLDGLVDVELVASTDTPVTVDATHPILTLPNTLNHANYPRGTHAWDFTGSNDRGRFMEITGPGLGLQSLVLSRLGTYGSGGALDGALILTSYQPGGMDGEEARRFFANTILYGKYHSLYLELGPPVPQDDVVASFSRSATMNKIRSGVANYTEMIFVLYVWPGKHTATIEDPVAVPPMAATSLTSTVVSASQVTFGWTQPASLGTHTTIDQVAIDRRLVPDGPATSFSAGTAPATGARSWDDTSVTAGSDYFYTVTVHTVGGGAGARAASVSAAPRAPVAAPTGVTAYEQPPATPAGYINVTWTPPATPGAGNVYGYRLLVEHNLSGPFTTVGEIGNESWYHYPVTHTGDHRFKMQALNAVGWSVESGASNAVRPPMTANAPVLTVSNATSNQLALAWVAPTDLGTGALQGYRVHRNVTGSSTEFAELAYIGNPVTVNYLDTAVKDGMRYWYKVQAVTSVGDGLNSSAETNTTHNTPAAPTGVYLVSRLIDSTISWNAPTDNGGTPVTSYKIYRGTTAENVAYLGDAVVNLYVASGATPAYYAVSAVNAAGEGPRSAPILL